MQLVNTTLVTHTDKIKELIQYFIAHDIEGPVNLDIKGDGTVNVWQPDTRPVQESVTSVPRVVSFDRVKSMDEYEQPSDNIQH